MHDHNHHHHHEVSVESSKAFIVGIVLNAAYVAVQAIAGFMMNSMALLSDAGHNLSDVASLALSFLALRLARVKPTSSYTYGYRKSTILAALTNAVILLVAIGMLAYGSIQRLLHPEPVQGGPVAIVAGIGIIVNFGTALLFFRHKEHDLNTRSAYLHMLSDALVSLGVVIGGIAIKYTGWYVLDGAISLVILLVILFSTWSLLTRSLRLSMDAVPADIDPQQVLDAISAMENVENVHHLHIWAMSTTENALTAHVVLNDQLSFDEKMALLQKIKHELLHMAIHHATLELEAAVGPCEDELC
jgi:cobalt-zinc-cadmium efflux system protein